MHIKIISYLFGAFMVLPLFGMEVKKSEEPVTTEKKPVIKATFYFNEEETFYYAGSLYHEKNFNLPGANINAPIIPVNIVIDEGSSTLWTWYDDSYDGIHADKLKRYNIDSLAWSELIEEGKNEIIIRNAIVREYPEFILELTLDTEDGEVKDFRTMVANSKKSAKLVDSSKTKKFEIINSVHCDQTENSYLKKLGLLDDTCKVKRENFITFDGKTAVDCEKLSFTPCFVVNGVRSSGMMFSIDDTLRDIGKNNRWKLANTEYYVSPEVQEKLRNCLPASNAKPEKTSIVGDTIVWTSSNVELKDGLLQFTFKNNVNESEERQTYSADGFKTEQVSRFKVGKTQYIVTDEHIQWIKKQQESAASAADLDKKNGADSAKMLEQNSHQQNPARVSSDNNDASSAPEEKLPVQKIEIKEFYTRDDELFVRVNFIKGDQIMADEEYSVYNVSVGKCEDLYSSKLQDSYQQYTLPVNFRNILADEYSEHSKKQKADSLLSKYLLGTTVVVGSIVVIGYAMYSRSPQFGQGFVNYVSSFWRNIPVPRLF